MYENDITKMNKAYCKNKPEGDKKKMAKYKQIYIKLKEPLSRSIDCVEFEYTNCHVVNVMDYIALFNEDALMIFKCKMDDIEKFVVLN